MRLPIVAGRVALVTAAPGAGDNPYGGLIVSSAGAARAVAAAPTQYSNGYGFSATGQLCYIDATAGLPADTTFSNGLPFSAGRLCTSTGAIDEVNGEVPFAANGAIAATIT